jgi:hypothetical protein
MFCISNNALKLAPQRAYVVVREGPHIAVMDSGHFSALTGSVTAAALFFAVCLRL